MGYLFFFLIFFIVVLVHEFGHYIIARASGIGIREFFIGMGPTLLHFEKGGTKYSLKLFPIGGACIFEGEDGVFTDEEEGVKEEDKGIFVNGIPFPDASVAKRFATVFAGPFFNFILAFLFSLIIVATIGSDPAVIGDVVEGGAAEKAGLQAGDVILKINNENIHLFRDVTIDALVNKGEDVRITYKRDGIIQSTILSPIYSEEENRYYFGIMGERGYTKFDALGTVKYSFYEVRYWINMVFKSLKMLFTGRASIKDLSGPVGMADTVSDIYKESKPDGFFYVFINMINFTVLISANLGLMNLLPFPALDGGRLVLFILEAIRRKPLPPEKEGIFHMIGFALLMLLMVVVLYQDILRIIGKF